MTSTPRTFTQTFTGPREIPHDLPRSPTQGRATLADYRLVKPIGVGGMGTVYLATHLHRDNETSATDPIALKVMNLGASARRFENESEVLASLNHPHIVRTYDRGKTLDGRPFFTMEYVAGAAIHDYCDRFCLPIAQRLELFLDICHAVQHVHDQGFVHRDLKPANVLVTGRGAVKLLDFGIARRLDDGGTGHNSMTPAYASPEQIQGLRTKEVSDIYSLGGLLYKLLTGQAPHRGLANRLYQLGARQTEKTPAPPSTLARRVCGELDKVTLKALCFQASDRYASAAEMGEGIRRYLAGQPILTGSIPLKQRISEKFKRSCQWTSSSPFASGAMVIS